MTALLAFVAALVGGLATLVLVRRPPGMLLGPRHLRENYRGRTLPGTLGAVLTVPLGCGAGTVVLVDPPDTAPGLLLAGAGAVMAILGLLDDLYASRRAGGFAGHLRALLRGEVTTGLLKAGGGGLVGLGAAWALGLRGAWIPVGGLVVALTTNLVNLLDLRPGRAGKVWLAAWLCHLAALPPASAVVAGAAVFGGLAAFLPADLRERGMLGDTGANLLGAVLGVSLVAAVGHGGLVVLLVVLVALTVASEIVSFSRVIERVRPLNALDRLGRAGG